MSYFLKATVLFCPLLLSPIVFAQSSAGGSAPTPLHAWAGYHIGFDVGSRPSSANQALNVNDPQQSLSGQGANADQSPLLGTSINTAKNVNLAGLHAEYLLQQESLVYGVAANLTALRCKAGSATGSTLNDPSQTYPNYASTIQGQMCLDNFSSVTAKVGKAVGNALFFVDGGVAIARAKFSTTATIANIDNPAPSDAWTGSGSKNMMGYVVGLGMQYAFTEHVTAGLNVQHYDLGKLSYTAQPDGFTATDLPGVTQSISARAKGNLLRVSVGYQF